MVAGWARQNWNNDQATAQRSLGDAALRKQKSIDEQRFMETAAFNETLDLMRANNKLKEENAQLLEQNQQAENLLMSVAQRSEAFRRVIAHMKQNWAPENPAEEALKNDVVPLVDEKIAEVAQDAHWQEDTRKKIEGNIKPPRKRKP